MSDKEMTYSKAGVDREDEEKVVQSILDIIRTTQKDSIREGHYAGSIRLGDLLLSLTTDGVGTKVILAQELERFETIGIDCVAMNVNDLICIGSIPKAFVDYIAIRKPDEEIITQIMTGLAEGCKQAEIPLVGGETAVLPEILTPIRNENGFDVAGTALGIHRIGETIDGTNIREGDTIIGIESSGIHSNGLTLARKVIDTKEIKKELLTPTRIYVRAIKSLISEFKNDIRGIAHITGGGFTNLLRLGNYRYNISLPLTPEIFQKIQQTGNISNREMYRTFNNGIGMCIIVPKQIEVDVINHLDNFYPSHRLGDVGKGNEVIVNSVEI